MLHSTQNKCTETVASFINSIDGGFTKARQSINQLTDVANSNVVLNCIQI